ncbi:MAG: DUF2461 domain-containing protein [Chitinophagales bacterium]|nr:DUF2461 domain-containing protein [Chitinophagales bacterium]
MHQLHPKTLKFLSGLKKNNNKEWFEKNRETYAEIRNTFINVVQEVINEINFFDTSLGTPDAKKCLFRINRDIRFSKDKSPYKINMGASMAKGGKNLPSAGYYLHVQPHRCFIGGGIWMPPSDNVNKIRQEIDYNFSDFKKIIESAAFKKEFESLSTEEKLARPPKNYAPDNPAIEYLKLKSFIATRDIKDEIVLSKNYLREVILTFRQLHPLISFINRAVA